MISLILFVFSPVSSTIDHLKQGIFIKKINIDRCAVRSRIVALSDRFAVG